MKSEIDLNREAITFEVEWLGETATRTGTSRVLVPL